MVQHERSVQPGVFWWNFSFCDYALELKKYSTQLSFLFFSVICQIYIIFPSKKIERKIFD